MCNSNNPGLFKAEKDAIDQYLVRSTIPLVEEGKDEEGKDVAAVLGTANLIEVADRVFLVTASHVFERFNPDAVGIPAITEDGRRAFLTLGGCVLSSFSDAGLDVAVVEVIPPRLKDALRRTNYTFLRPQDVAPYSATCDQYLMVGYPRAAAVQHGPNIWPRPVKITTTLFRGTPPDSFEADHDILLVHEGSGVSETGEVEETIPLKGISGSGVWGVSSEPAEVVGIWHPNESVRLVGVQVSYLKDSYIRVKRWWLVARMLQKIDVAVGDPFLERIAPRP